MAIIKDYVSKHGVNANYWKIGSVGIDRRRRLAQIELDLYINSDSLEFASLETRVVDILNDKYDILFFNFKNYPTIEACEAFLLSEDEFFIDATQLDETPVEVPES